METIRNKIQIHSQLRHHIDGGRLYKIMCGVLGFVVKFSSPQTSSKI